MACWLLAASVLFQRPLLEVRGAGTAVLIRSWDVAWLLVLCAIAVHLRRRADEVKLGLSSPLTRRYVAYAAVVTASVIVVAVTFGLMSVPASAIQAARFVVVGIAAVSLPVCLSRSAIKRTVMVASAAAMIGGFQAALALHTGKKEISTPTGSVEIGVTRPGGPFGNFYADGTADHWWAETGASTTLGLWLGVALAVFAVLALAPGPGRPRRWLTLSLSFVCTLTVMAGLAATSSREAWIGGVIVLAILLVLAQSSYSRRRVAAASLAVVVMVGLVTLATPGVRERFVDTVTPGTFSFRTGPEARIDAWKEGIKIGAERFPIGWGIGGVEEHPELFGRATAENLFIQVWMQTSVLGLFLFVAWLSTGLAYAARRAYLEAANVVAVFCFVVLVLIIVHGLFGYSIGDPTVQVLLALALAGLQIDPSGPSTWAKA